MGKRSGKDLCGKTKIKTKAGGIMKVFLGIALMLFGFSCNQPGKENNKNKVRLRTGTLNQAKLSDTLIVHQNTCRGCAYEYSTHFDVSDSQQLVQLNKIVTTNDVQSKDSIGVGKDLFLLPVKTGRTKIKLYKFYGSEATAEDSSHAIVYEIEIKK
jgi:hypothetical protein